MYQLQNPIPDKSFFNRILTKLKMKFHVTVTFALLACCYFASGCDGNSEKLKITVSYEALEPSAIEFFQLQLTAEVFKELSTCPIEWNFLPCRTSAMVDNVLTCLNKEEECDMDRIYACATNTYQNDQIKLGYFVICSMGSKCQKTDWEKCTEKIEMNTNDIKQCSGEKQADKLCNGYNDQLNHWQSTTVLSLMFGSQFNQELNDKAFNDFKGVVCEQLKKVGLECQACQC